MRCRLQPLMPEPFSVAGLAKEPNDEAIAPGGALLRGFALPLADDILGALGDITVQAQFPRMTTP